MKQQFLIGIYLPPQKGEHYLDLQEHPQATGVEVEPQME